MADNVVTFKKDGTFRRGEVNKLDVTMDAKASAAARLAEEAARAKAQQSKPAPVKQAQPQKKLGTFSLSALKTSVTNSSTSAPAGIAEPTPLAPKQDAPAAHEKEQPKQVADNVGAVVEIQTSQASDASDVVSQTGVQADVAEPATKQVIADTDNSGVPKEVMSTRDINLGSVEVSTMDLGVTDIKEQEGVAIVNAATAESAIDTVTTFKSAGAVGGVQSPAENAQASDAVDASNKESGVGESASAPKPVEVARSSEPVHKLQLSELQGRAKVPDTATQATQSEAPAELNSVVDATGAETFNILPLDKLLSIVETDRQAISGWIAKCIRRHSSAPAAIFTSADNDKLRFYNLFGLRSKGIIAIALGAGDAMTCIKYDTKTKEMFDFSAALRTEGNLVWLNGDDIIAVFSERNRRPVVV